jgi:putative DNA primase/helicase
MSKMKSAPSIQAPLQTLYCFTSESQQHVPASFSETGSERETGIGSYGRRNRILDSKNLKMCTASEVVSKPKTWIYPNWLQQGELTVLAAPPGAGKTTFASTLAAGITRGETYSLGHGLTPTGKGHVIIVNREDDVETALVPRLKAAGADLTRVHFIGCKVGLDSIPSFSFFNKQDLDRLECRVDLLGNNLGLIIIDPIYCAVDGEASNNHKAREAYEQLASIAKRMPCAILGIAHTVKNTQNKQPLARVGGPPALREVPRAIILLAKIHGGPTESGGRHVMVHAKNNEGKLAGGYEYRLMAVDIPEADGMIEATKLVITSQLIGSAEEILNMADGGKPAKVLLKSQVAENFLRAVLDEGARPKHEIMALAEKAGVRLGTLLYAKTSLKILTHKRTGDGRSVWRLPDPDI